MDSLKISKSSLYSTFNDKHKLFTDSLQRYIIEILKDCNAVISCESSPMSTIQCLIEQAIKRAFEDRDCIFIKSVFEMASLDDDIRKILKNSTNTFIDLMEGLLLKAREQGEFNLDRNINETAIFIVASFAGFYQMQVLYDNRKMLDQMAANLIRYLH